MVIVAINECYGGSTGNIARIVLNHAKSKGHECYFAYHSGPKNIENSIIISQPFLFGLYCKIKAKLTGSDGFYHKYATKRLINQLEKINPDIVHIHNLHGLYINVRILFDYLKKKQIKVIWTFHDCWPVTGRCAHFDYVGCDKWKSKCAKCAFKRLYPRSYLFDYCKKDYLFKKSLFESIDGCFIISPSNWLNNIISQSIAKRLKHLTIYNGIDLLSTSIDNEMFNKVLKIKTIGGYEKIVFSAAYPFNEKKGISFITRLANDERMKKTLFVVAGLSKSQTKKMPVNVLSVGYIKKRECMNSLYSIADVFLNPTLEEVFGLVNVESMMNGTPVIVFNVGGCSEIITDDTGLIVDKDNYNCLAEAVLSLSKTKSISEACKKRSTFFSCDIMCDKYLEIYESFKK